MTATLDAVSPLIYMTPQGVDFPGVMTFEGDPGTKGFRANPYPIGQLFQADIIMAAVMMSRAVYQNSRYSWHRQGEDLGWATDCAHKGYKLYCASHIYAPHVMHRAMLASYLVEGDSRASLRI
ncbi:MAG TPA: hypothetical protein VJ742_12305 [Nitrososphaera sp.]|nr:hypothetical protein [Nitrososphaera sp.]